MLPATWFSFANLNAIVLDSTRVRAFINHSSGTGHPRSILCAISMMLEVAVIAIKDSFIFSTEFAMDDECLLFYGAAALCMIRYVLFFVLLINHTSPFRIIFDVYTQACRWILRIIWYPLAHFTRNAMLV